MSGLKDSRSAWIGLGTKGLSGLEDCRGRVCVDSVASGVSAPSDDMDMSVPGREPWERLTSGILLHIMACTPTSRNVRTLGAMLVAAAPRADVEIH